MFPTRQPVQTTVRTSPMVPSFTTRSDACQEPGQSLWHRTCRYEGDIFVSGNDFRLKPGSPAIDAGATIEEVSTDFAGVPRPQGPKFDIGAYEYTAVDLQPPAAPTAVQVE